MLKRILVIDDDMEFLQLLSSILQKQFQVYEPTGVAEAMKVLETVSIDTICSDLNMRDGTGLGLLKRLRQEDIKIPFLLMSGDDDIRIRNEAQSCGATFCCKTDHELLDKISAMRNY